MTTPLVEQQRTIQDALDVMALRERPTDPVAAGRFDSDVDRLRFALADHQDPEIGCLAEQGRECLAVVKARKIIGGLS